MLDVGCGTGIAARQFQAAGCTVLGIDIDERMAGFARRRGLEVEVAAFEDWDRAGRTFGLVMSAQTWHWIDPTAGAAKAAEALRWGGRFAALWNAFDASPEIAQAFSSVYSQVTPDYDPWARPAVDAYSAIFAKSADAIRAVRAFGIPEQWRFDWQQSYTRDEWLEAVLTGGGVSQFTPATLKDLLAGIGGAVMSHSVPHAALVYRGMHRDFVDTLTPL